MKAGLGHLKTATWAALAAALALTATAWSQSTPQSNPSPATPTAQQAPATAPSGQQQGQNTPTADKPAPGTTPVAGDVPSPSQQQAPASTQSGQQQGQSTPTAGKPAPGTTPVAGDVPAPPPDKSAKNKKDKKGKNANNDNVNVDPDKVVPVGGDLIKVKPGSEEDVSAVGNREIGKRGLGNWYSTDGEIKMGRMYASEIDKSTKFITDPVVTEYINRIGQNLVKNSDCKVPFTIKVIDSDEINAMALPGGFFYVNSGLILNADEEAEVAGVMAHEIAHVCAHHAAREMTRMNYAQIGTIPLIMMTGYSWTGYGIYEAAQFAVPVTFLKFSRDFEAEADYLGVQYMYRAGYDPQAFITFFEKIQALEKRKPGLVAKAFSDHPQTPDRILHSQEEIERILPPKQDYLVTTSEFDQVKARLARIENKRRLLEAKDTNKPSLRRAGDQGQGDDRPTLQRREDKKN